MLAAGYLDEAKAWREWLLRAVAGDPATLQVMYAVDGTRRLPETEIPWLRGYEASSPVRTGNAAATQLQLDVWGETLDALHLAREVQRVEGLPPHVELELGGGGVAGANRRGRLVSAQPGDLGLG